MQLIISIFTVVNQQNDHELGLIKRRRAFKSSSSNPHISLWTLWAIKESAYKALKKQDPNTKFIPPQYECRSYKNDWICSFRNKLAFVKVFTSEKFVHAIATTQEDALYYFAVSKFADDSLHGQMARDLAIKLIEEKENGSICTIVRDSQEGILWPPQVFLNGTLSEKWDVSLSHDGQYCAAVVALVSKDEK